MKCEMNIIRYDAMFPYKECGETCDQVNWWCAHLLWQCAIELISSLIRTWKWRGPSRCCWWSQLENPPSVV